VRLYYLIYIAKSIGFLKYNKAYMEWLCLFHSAPSVCIVGVNLCCVPLRQPWQKHY